MNVLGIPVSADLRNSWRQWLAPNVQPFFVESLGAWPKGVTSTASLSPELQHTYKTWRIDRSLEILWLDESTFFEIPRQQRAALLRTQRAHGRGAVPSVRRWSHVLDGATLRAQADGHRFVWWPSLVETNPHEVLARVVAAAPEGAETDAPPSRHQDVEAATWETCAAALPDAQRLAATFPRSSGPNCFAAVMAAAGVSGAGGECMLQAPFLAWLDSSCRRGGRDRDAGTVLVWRDSAGQPVHAAVTIGDGWALEKASGEWWTPHAVRTVRDVIRTARAGGQHLERQRIVSGERNGRAR